jgi:hypothetical protein
MTHSVSEQPLTFILFIGGRQQDMQWKKDMSAVRIAHTKLCDGWA